MTLDAVQPQVFKFCDEAVLLLSLFEDTFSLMKKTRTVSAIKKLIEVYDILDVNLTILKKFQKDELTFDEVWLDTATLRYLNHVRCELYVYHRKDFDSPKEFDAYNRIFVRFLNLIILRLRNGFSMTELDFIAI